MNNICELKMKRVRGSNFSIMEKNIFLDALERRKDVIECKKTDGTTSKLKEATWQEICDDFNSCINVTKRNVKQLKSFYDNFKRQVKKNRADDRIELFKTGGGVFKPKSDHTSDKLLAIISNQTEPLQNDMDSDASYQVITTRNAGDIQDISEEVPVILHTEEQDVEISSPAATPSWMRRNRPSSTKLSEASKVRASVAELADERKAIFEQEKKMLLEKAAHETEIYELKKEALLIQKEVLLIQKQAEVAKLKYYEQKRKEICGQCDSCSCEKIK